MSVVYNITAQSKPDYDEWGWDDYWSCADWVKYHVELKKTFGADVAKQMWYQAWEKQDGTASPYNWCKYNSHFYDYFKKEFGETWFLMEIGGAVGGAAEGINRVVKSLGVVAPILIVAGAAGALWWAYRKFIKKQA